MNGHLSSTSTAPFVGSVAAVAAFVSLGAAASHFAVIADHYAEYPLFGIAFLAIAFFQAVWALVFFRRPTRALAAIAAMLNGGVVGVWVLSRVVRLPFGPHSWIPPEVGLADTASSVLESGVIALLALRWYHGHRGLLLHLTQRVAAIVPLLLITVASIAIVLTVPTHPDAPSGPVGGSNAEADGRDAGHGSQEPTEEESEEHEPGPFDVPIQPINFGAAFDASGQIVEPTIEVRAAEQTVWTAYLAAPVQSAELTLSIAKVGDASAQSDIWTRIIPIDPETVRLSGRDDLGALAGGVPGTYVLNCEVAGTVIAASTFVIVP